MAGVVRQPLDVNALEMYLKEQVEYIKTPVSIKQVRLLVRGDPSYIY